MAKKPTAQQRATRNLIDRAKRLEKQGFIFDYEVLKSLPTAQANRLQRSKLRQAAVEFRLPKTSVHNEPEVIPASVYEEYRAAAEAYKRANRRIDPFFRVPKLATGTRAGIETFTANLKAKTGIFAQKQRQDTYVDNYIKTLGTLNNEALAHLIWQKIIDKGSAWAAKRLKQAQDNQIEGIWGPEVFNSRDPKYVINVTAYLNWWGITPEEYERETMGVEYDEFETEWEDDF